MDIIRSKFGKSVDQLEISDIERFFATEQLETNRMEFKSYNPRGRFEDKLNGLLPTICALLNSEGGVLIWGAPSGKKALGKKEKSFSGPLEFVTELHEKDALINKLSDNITPMPIGLTADAVGVDGEYVYIFQVNESNYKPHQADNRYYIRLDGQTRIAPHYYIESMFKQVRTPEIEGYIKFDGVHNSHYGPILKVQTLIFNWSHTHNEKNLIVILSSPHGIFREFLDGTAKQDRYHEYHFEGHHSLSRYLDDTLFYGSPIVEPFSIVFKNDFIHSAIPVELILRFGGDSSPQKESYYKFRFRKGEKPNVEMLETLINKPLSEIREEIGKTKEETIKYYLNR